MSETMTIPPPGGEALAKKTPTVYFIDDSATMREVIKIAFRRENINVITCPMRPPLWRSSIRIAPTS